MSNRLDPDETCRCDFHPDPNCLQSNNPDLLTEVTYGEIGVSPMVEKSGTGRMSPVRGRTMKEYDLQISELKKENFNLKLRIFFLEERLNTKYSGEDTIKTNIELKVEVESYKQDLLEKQHMLEKASETIDSMTAKYSEELEKEVMKINKEFEDKLENANKRVADLEDNLKEMEKQLDEKEETLLENKCQLVQHKQTTEALNQDVEDRDSEIADLTGQLQACKRQLEGVRQEAEKQKTQYLEDIERLTTSETRKDRDIQRLSVIVKDKTTIEGVTALERAHLQDAMEDANTRVEKLQKLCADKERENGRKEELLGRLEDLLRKKEKEKEVLRKAFDDKNEMYQKSKEHLQEFIKEMYNKNAENADLMERNEELQKTIQRLEEQIHRLQQELNKAGLEKQRELEKAGSLEQELERLARSLGKKEGELETFKDLLETAERSLSESEAVVTSLERELTKEQNRRKVNEEEVGVGQLRQELADLQSQLEEQEQMYKAKCDELDSVARCLNIHVTSAGSSGGEASSDRLQQILAELQHLKDAVQSDRHLHINISSAFQAQDGGMPRGDANGSPRQNGFSSPKQNGFNSTYPGYGHHHSSRIPVRKSSSTSSNKEDSEELQKQVTDLTARNKDLEETLKATEETVHCQTQKMKFYRNMLIDHDLLPATLSRSNSVPNMDKLALSPRSVSPGPRRHIDRASESHQRSRSESFSSGLHPTLKGNKHEKERIEKLLDENCSLKQKVDGYKKVLRAFQDRSPSPVSTGKGDKHDTGPQPISSDSACRQLEGWLDMLDRFLMEMSQGDQCGGSPTVSSTTDVSSLRRGLIQARGAVQTLSETSVVDQGYQEKTGSEGRLSPDSGCSDNNTASAPQTLKSPLVSPARSQCSGSSSQEKSPTSPRTFPSSPRRFQTSPQNKTGSRLNVQNHCFSGEVDQLSSDQEFAQLPNRKISGKQSGSTSSEVNYNCPDRNSMDSLQSLEYLRHCSERTAAGEITRYSLPSVYVLDSSVHRHNDTTTGKPKTVSFIHNVPADGRGSQDSGGDHRKVGSVYRSRESLYKNTLTQSMLGDTLDDSVAEKTLDHQSFSRIDFGEHSVLDITQDLTSQDKAQLQEQIRSLEDIIASYQERINQNSRPDMSALHQQLLELRQLRIQLEKSMKNNENLERLLNDLARASESTIQDLKREVDNLRNKLAQCQYTIREKVHIISENERILSVLRDNSNRDSTDLELNKERVVSLEHEVKEKSAKCEQLAGLCQPLKHAVEQYKQRCEQLENDNKKHQEAVSKYQNRNKQIENELIVKGQGVEKVSAEVERLTNRIAQLEGDTEIYRDNETKYKSLLAQNRSQLAKLVAELEQLREEYKQMESVKEELESTRDTVEEQDRQLIEKSLRIEQLTQDCNDKCEQLHNQEEERQQLENNMENVNTMNSKLSTQLEQQRLNCANYKRQVDKHNHAMKEMKDRIEQLSEELVKARENRSSMEKHFTERQRELQEVTRLRDKYLYNLKFVHKEFVRCKKDYQEMEKKYKNTSALNSSLTVELNVREKLMDDKGTMLTDDAKQNIIAELLNELKCARVQMTAILEQNDAIKQKMSQLIVENEAAKKSGAHQPSMECRSRLTEDFLEKHSSSSGNVTWPLYDDIPDSSKGGNSRHSLPARERTLEGSVGDEGKSINSEAQDMKSSKFEFSDSLSSPAGVQSGPHFSVPGPIYKQGISDNCLLYNVNDSPKHLAGMTQYRIDSDVRSLFAVGMIDHFEKLRKETNECNVLLKGLSTRINERLKAFTLMPASESMEYSTLKELSFSAGHLQICVNSQQSMINCFWTSELPAPNEKGEFVNSKLLNENLCLQEKLCGVQTENKHLAKLDKVRKERSLQEEDVCRSYVFTHTIDTRYVIYRALDKWSLPSVLLAVRKAIYSTKFPAQTEAVVTVVTPGDHDVCADSPDATAPDTLASAH